MSLKSVGLWQEPVGRHNLQPKFEVGQVSSCGPGDPVSLRLLSLFCPGSCVIFIFYLLKLIPKKESDICHLSVMVALFLFLFHLLSHVNSFVQRLTLWG